MSSIPEELHYTKDHEWVRSTSDSRYQIGITDFAQGALGDIVYIQLPKVGQVVTSGEVCGEVESTKSVSEIYSPLSGVVTSINQALDVTPELLNQDPYIAGWIAEIEVTSPASDLLTSTEYEALTA